MSYKLFLFIFGFLYIGGEGESNELTLQRSTDAWIQEILYAKPAKQCIRVKASIKDHITSEESSWTVALLKRIHYQNEIVIYFSCAGSLIHPQVVLTAAHCIRNTSFDNLTALAGHSSRIDDGQQERHVDSIFIHENFTDDGTGNDIALIFLQEPFTVNKFVDTICLPPSSSAENVNCTLSTWNLRNRMTDGHPPLTTHKRTVVSRCERVLQETGLGKNFTLPKDMMCIGGELNKTALWGNSGAPLTCQVCGAKSRTVLTGILSFGFDASQLPDVVTNVKPHRKWIRQTSLKSRFKIKQCINKILKI